MSTQLRFLIIFIGGVLAVMPCTGQITADHTSTLQEAIEQLDQAIQQTGTLEEGSDVAQAAAVLAFVLNRDGIDSAAGHRTLGNAYFIGNDLGRAILHYNRGLLIDPNNPVLKQNLAHARSFVEPTVPSDTKRLGGIQSVLLSWQRVIDPWTLWILTIGMLSLSSLLWTAKAAGFGNRVPHKIPAGLAASALIGVALLGLHQWTTNHDQRMVVILPGTEMYSGPGTRVYQEVYDGPLGIGTEAILLDTRDEWLQIRLNNAQEGWILDHSIEMVRQ
ncbi:MAG: hypothetical protein JKY43_09975 [Phycisphaerales bacterium]|nr:hypothetical protein [Phycisphaerales bacterium]